MESSSTSTILPWWIPIEESLPVGDLTEKVVSLTRNTGQFCIQLSGWGCTLARSLGQFVASRRTVDHKLPE
jgi:hypothetical protein